MYSDPFTKLEFGGYITVICLLLILAWFTITEWVPDKFAELEKIEKEIEELESILQKVEIRQKFGITYPPAYEEKARRLFDLEREKYDVVEARNVYIFLAIVSLGLTGLAGYLFFGKIWELKKKGSDIFA
jgi:hypothetical protein